MKKGKISNKRTRTPPSKVAPGVSAQGVPDSHRQPASVPSGRNFKRAKPLNVTTETKRFLPR